MYYRLFDRQCYRFMATGYNAKSKKELFDDYASYKSNDWDEEMTSIWNKMPSKEKWIFILDDEFDIEESKTPFEEQD